MRKAEHAAGREPVRHSGFVILWSFVIGISSLSRASLRRLLQGYERSKIRHPPIAEEPRLHRRSRAHTRARHRCQHSDVQRRQCRLTASFAFSRTRTVVMGIPLLKGREFSDADHPRAPRVAVINET